MKRLLEIGLHEDAMLNDGHMSWDAQHQITDVIKVIDDIHALRNLREDLRWMLAEPNELTEKQRVFYHDFFILVDDWILEKEIDEEWERMKVQWFG